MVRALGPSEGRLGLRLWSRGEELGNGHETEALSAKGDEGTLRGLERVWSALAAVVEQDDVPAPRSADEARDLDPRISERVARVDRPEDGREPESASGFGEAPPSFAKRRP